MSDNARFHNKLHRKNHHTSPTAGYPDSATDPIASATEPFQGDFYISGNLNVTGALNTTFNTLSNISIPTPVLSATIGFNPVNSLIVQLSGTKYAIPLSYVGTNLAPAVITNAISGITTFSNGLSVLGSLSGVDSINWNNVYTTVATNSAGWVGGYTALTDINTSVVPNSAFWQGTYSTVAANSGLWTTGAYIPLVYTLTQSTSSITPVLGNNISTGLFSNIAGGSNNQALSSYNTVLGGYFNIASGQYSNIAGGQSNAATGNWSNVAGGYLNCSSGNYTTVVGGESNCALNYASAVIGGFGNVASGNSSSIGGGLNNTASGYYSSVAGGSYNRALSSASNVNGGVNNTASGRYSVVGGGKSNAVAGSYSGILGGFNNSLSGCNSFIIGSNITANACDTTIVSNLSSCGNIYGTFYGDGANITNVLHVFDKIYNAGTCTGAIQPISGANTSSGYYSNIVGGKNNKASVSYSAVIGGACNIASGQYSIVGGCCNTASSQASTIVNGATNTASSTYSSVLNGKCNTASGNYATVLGGICNNTNSQSNTFILGSCITATLPNYTYVNNLSSPGSIYAKYLFGDGTNLTSTTYLYSKTCNQSVATNSIIPKLGNNTASGYYSFIAGGSANNTNGLSNVFILGTGLSAISANYTYVNNISSRGIVSANTLYGDGSNLVNVPNSTVLTNTSATWNNTYTTLTANSAIWSSSYTTLSSLSANWNTAYSAVTGLSASITTAAINVVSIANTVTGSSSPFSVIGSNTGSTKTFFYNSYNGGLSATTDILITNSLLVPSISLDIGVATSTFNGNSILPSFNIAKGNDSYMYSTSGNLAIGTNSPSSVNGDLIFFTGNTLSGTSVTGGSERVRITNTNGPLSGNVGINTSTPNQQLTVNGGISGSSTIYAPTINTNTLQIGSLTATNTAVGSLTAKMPIYNANGTFIGYIPIYTS